MYILYKDILGVCKPEMSIKQIAKSVNKENGKAYNTGTIGRLLSDMEILKLVKRVIDEPKCVRYERTPKGEHLLKAESVDKIRR